MRPSTRATSPPTTARSTSPTPRCFKATRPELKITNPYELDDKQFQAAVDLLKRQRQNIGQYWADYTKEQAAFASGDSTVGTTWQVIANLLEGDRVPVKTTLPKEGSTGWSDTWLLSSKAQHPNCAYQWMNWIISPKVNAQVAEWFGEAPANQKACAKTSDLNHCKTFHAGDDAYFNRVSFWATPRTQCGDLARLDLRGLRQVGPGVDGDQGVIGAGPGRGAAAWLWRRPRLQVAGLLAGPLGWLVIAYLGSLAVLFVAAFWRLDDFSGKIVHDYGVSNFVTLAEGGVYRTIVARTVLIAAAVTVTDAILAFPIAFTMASAIPVYLAHRLTVDREGDSAAAAPAAAAGAAH